MAQINDIKLYMLFKDQIVLILSNFPLSKYLVFLIIRVLCQNYNVSTVEFNHEIHIVEESFLRQRHYIIVLK